MTSTVYDFSFLFLTSTLTICMVWRLGGKIKDRKIMKRNMRNDEKNNLFG